MTDEPKGPAPDDEVYVIDDTGETQDVRDLAGYRDAPEPVVEGGNPPGDGARDAGEAEETDGSELGSLRAENEKLKDQFLRSREDFENYRRRMEKEKTEFRRYAVADTLRDLLPVLDNFERALEVPSAGDVESFRKGFELIHTQLLELLRRRGVTPIEALGTDFDPNVHEAVVHEPSATHRDGEVMQELQRGYRLGERLLRPAMVKVAKRT